MRHGIPRFPLLLVIAFLHGRTLVSNVNGIHLVQGHHFISLNFLMLPGGYLTQTQ